ERWPDGTRVLAGPPHRRQHVVVIDRAHDATLVDFLDREIAPLRVRHERDPLGLVDAVMRKVRGALAYDGNTDDAVGAHEILLGDYLAARSGVCRHYAAITKVALDELAL